MGLRLSILVVVAGMIWALNPVVDHSDVRCLQCHRSHHEKLGTCVDCHQGNPGTLRRPIAHDRLVAGEYVRFRLPKSVIAEDGRRLISQFACRRCHWIAGSGNRLAADLDRTRLKTLPDRLATAIRTPAIFMPDFYFSERIIITLVNAILDSNAAASMSGEFFRVIHFERSGEHGDNIFNQRCGSCHRILTRQYGGLGQGNIGPDLSGFLTGFYPQNYMNGLRWDMNGLKIWLNNPRQIRKFAPMLPIQLSNDEIKRLASLFQDQI